LSNYREPFQGGGGRVNIVFGKKNDFFPKVAEKKKGPAKSCETEVAHWEKAYGEKKKVGKGSRIWFTKDGALEKKK